MEPIGNPPADVRLRRGWERHMGSHRIQAEYWCVTRQEFTEFERLVKAAWLRGDIPDSADYPNPKHNDATTGPSMYQVNQHFIKQWSRNHDGLSYALGHCTEGREHDRKCDLFVTHAWQEGVFEFCRKVQNSWPRDCKNLWCCFLANPQVLDINALLSQTPVPFKRALNEATTVLVVPNESLSIYKRLWCVYEAYLAVLEKKRIIVASSVTYPKIAWKIFSAMKWWIPGACAGVPYVAHYWFSTEETPSIDGALFIVVLCLWILVVICLWIFPMWGKCGDVLVFALGALSICGENSACVRAFATKDAEKLRSCVDGVITPVVLGLVPVAWVAMEVLHVRASETAKEQLQFDKDNFVESAECKSESDKNLIKGEIDGHEERVKGAILQLLECGVFDRELNELHEKGIVVSRKEVDVARRVVYTAGAILLYAIYFGGVILDVEQLEQDIEKAGAAGDKSVWCPRTQDREFIADTAVYLFILTICFQCSGLRFKGLCSRGLSARLGCFGGIGACLVTILQGMIHDWLKRAYCRTLYYGSWAVFVLATIMLILGWCGPQRVLPWRNKCMSLGDKCLRMLPAAMRGDGRGTSSTGYVLHE